MDKTMYITRDLEKIINQYIDIKEIIAIVGVRQCGKTTLMKKIAEDLKSAGKKINFISFDDTSVKELFEEDISSFIKLHIKPFDCLFIDEIQYARDSGRKLKFIYDSSDIKIFISGSSAAEISIQSLKYLVGRIFTFVLYPFSFREFLRSKEENLIDIYNEGKYGSVMVQMLNDYLKEFMLFGGFPRVVTAEHVNEKKLILKNIYNTYILREIREIFQISSDYKLVKLMKALSLQIGNIINYQELNILTETNFPELKKYLNILQKSYIIQLVQPFFTNKRTELVKSPKVYFIDHGFRNICIDTFSGSLSQTGAMFEQFVLSEFIKSDMHIKFWRSKSGAEVDFVIEKEGPVPIEIKVNLKSPKRSRSFHSFVEKYKPSTGYILSPGYEDKIQKENTTIHFYPIVKSNLVNRGD